MCQEGVTMCQEGVNRCQEKVQIEAKLYDIFCNGPFEPGAKAVPSVSPSGLIEDLADLYLTEATVTG